MTKQGWGLSIALVLGGGALLVATHLVTWRVALSSGGRQDRQMVPTMRRALQEASQAKAQLTDELTRAREDLDRALKDVTRLHGELEGYAGRSETERALQERIGVLERELQKASKQTRRSEGKDIARLTSALTKAERAEKALKAKSEADLRTLRARLESQQGDLEATRVELAKIRKDYAAAHSTAKQLERQLHEATRDYERDLKRLREDLAEAESAQQQLSVQQKEVERLQRELVEANDRIGELIVALDTQEQLMTQQARQRTPDTAMTEPRAQ